MMGRARITVVTVLGAVALHAAWSAPAAAQPTKTAAATRENAAPQIAEFVAEASARFGVPEQWIWAVMKVESAGDASATSSAGAMGLMQVMPQTYASLRTEHGLGANAYDPHDNILAGAAYLRAMHDRYGDSGFLAAYNAGPTRYEVFRSGVRPLPPETTRYVAQLAGLLEGGDPLALPLPGPQARPTPETAPIFAAVSVTGAQSGGQPGAIRPAEDALEPSNRKANLPSRPSPRLAADVQPARAGDALFAAIGPRNPS